MTGRYINNSYLKVQQKNTLNVTCCKKICSRNIENNHEHYKNTIYEAYNICEADKSSNSFRTNFSSVHPSLT